MKTMRRQIFIAIVLGALLVAGFAFAQTTTPSTATSTRDQLKLRAQELNQLKTQLRQERTEIFQDIKKERTTLRTEVKTMLQNYASSSLEERQEIREQIKNQRKEVKENILALRQNLKENAKLLRENFREKFQNVKQRARIAAAHGRGLRMINRYRAAVQRFSHILGKLESRVEKLKDRGVDVSSVEPLIEEAHDMETAAEAKLEEFKDNYEKLLSGEQKVSEIAGKGKTIAKELKEEIVKLHDKLKEIVRAIAALERPLETSTSTPSSETTTPETEDNE